MVKVKIRDIQIEPVRRRINWQKVLSELKKGEAIVIPLGSINAARKRLSVIGGLEFGKNTEKKEAYVYWVDEPQEVNLS